MDADCGSAARPSEEKPIAMAQRAYTITRNRIAIVVAVVVVGIFGALLPYLTVTYLNFTSEVVRPTHALFPTTGMLGTMDISYFPSASRSSLNTLQHGIDLLQLGATMQEVGLVAAIITISCIVMNEINKFFWWPMIIAGFLLALGPISFFIGAHLMSGARVSLSVGFGWVPLLVVGLFVIVVALRSRSRMDTYRGV